MFDMQNLLDPATLIVLAVVLLALGLLVAGLSLARRGVLAWRRERDLNRALQIREGQAHHEDGQDLQQRLQSAVSEAVEVGKRWQKGRFGDSLLAAEDKALIDLCGFENPVRARSLFVFGRGFLALLLPTLGWLLLGAPVVMGNPLLGMFLILFFGFGLGWMLPKWWLVQRAAARKTAAADELPLLIDLLRLLQGVGLSVDQSLHVVVQDFRDVMPVLAYELGIATEQYAHGRSREQSFHRLAKAYDNDDLSAICALIEQVDRHGGAVQEPLTRFAERIREQRKLGMKERIGKLTVKMTGVMVLTLLPALLIVTGGAGMLAVLRGLSRLGGV